MGENVPRFSEDEVPGFQARDPSQLCSQGDDAFSGHDFDEEGAFNLDAAGQEFFCLHEVGQGTMHCVPLSRIQTGCHWTGLWGHHLRRLSATVLALLSYQPV